MTNTVWVVHQSYDGDPVVVEVFTCAIHIFVVRLCAEWAIESEQVVDYDYAQYGDVLHESRLLCPISGNALFTVKVYQSLEHISPYERSFHVDEASP